VLGQLIERHEIGVGLFCFVLDRAVPPAVCDQPDLARRDQLIADAKAAT
jgi:hypothetical protein